MSNYLISSGLISSVARHTELTKNIADETFEFLKKKGKIQSFNKEEKIFSLGDKGDFLYILLKGKVHTAYFDSTVSTILPGQIGGLTSLIVRSGKRSLDHVAVEDSLIFKIPGEVFHQLLDRRDFRDSVLRLVANKVRHKNVVLANMLIPHKDTGSLSIAFFDTKPYDVKYFTETFQDAKTKDGRIIKLNFHEVKLTKRTVTLAAGSEAVCVFVNDTCDKEVLKKLKAYGCHCILLRCAGFNNVDLDSSETLGITVLRVPAYSPYAVAEHAFALLQTLNRRTHVAFNRVRNGNFSLKGLEGRDLHGLTCGIFGSGKIGECFANIAYGCGMKILFWDPYPRKELEKKFNAVYIKDKFEMLSKCNVISMHLPLTDMTKHFIDEKAIAAMPKGCIVLNTSRGPIIKSTALLNGILSGHLGGAGLDVYENEKEYFFEDFSGSPITDDILARLINLPNVIVTSHQAFLTTNALKAISQTTKFNFEQYIEGKRKKDLTNVVEKLVPKL